MSFVPLQTAPGHKLRADAADAWDRVAREVKARYGWTPALTDSARDYDTQVRIFLERYDPKPTGSGPYGDVKYWNGVRYVRMRGASASVPGKSWHGKGLAVDVTGLGGFDSTRHAQVNSVAPGHGWTNTVGRAINEPWHWQYYPELDRHTGAGGGTTEEEDMTPDERRMLTESHNATRAILDLLTPGQVGVKYPGDVYLRLVSIEEAATTAVAQTGPIKRGDQLISLRQEVADIKTAGATVVERIWAHKPTGGTPVGQMIADMKQRVLDGKQPFRALFEHVGLDKKIDQILTLLDKAPATKDAPIETKDTQ